MTPASHSRKDRPSPDQYRAQLTALLPELREALRNGWRLRSLLASHGFERRLLDQLIEVHALDYHLTRTGRWRRFTWTWEGTDEELVELVLLFPSYQERGDAYPGYLKRAKQTRRCLRCRRSIERGTVYLQLRERTRTGPSCLACARPEDLPLSHRELEALRTDLERVVLLWPQELPIYAERLTRVGRLVQQHASPRGGDLYRLGHDLLEVGDWLKVADRKLQPRRELLLEPPPAPIPDDQLAETVGEHPLALPEGEARAVAEARLAHRAAEQRRRRDADYLHYGLIHATSWLRDLFLRLQARHIELTA